MWQNCPFLELAPSWGAAHPYRCWAGVNFSSVGPDRELCQTCPIGQYTEILACPYLEVYTFLHAETPARPFVRVEVQCHIPEEEVRSGHRCQDCPARGETLNRVPYPALHWSWQGAQSTEETKGA